MRKTIARVYGSRRRSWYASLTVWMCWGGLIVVGLYLMQAYYGVPFYRTEVLAVNRFSDEGEGVWRVSVPRGAVPGRGHAYRVRLFEDGKELGPMVRGRTRLPEEGPGAYWMKSRTLRLFVGEEGGPTENGRVYRVTIPIPIETSELIWAVVVFGLLLGHALCFRVNRETLRRWGLSENEGMLEG
ncbi:MAG: hypothetical protein AAGD22_03655 [Verrucomicrobiota bacterium]